MIEKFKKHESLIRIITTSISLVALIISLILNLQKISLSIDLAWIAIILCGTPIIVGALIGIIKDHDITADVLVSLALIGSLILKEWFAAGEVAFIMQLGSILEDFTAAKAKSGISKLIKLTPKKANISQDGIIKCVPIEEIKVGDEVIVHAGETIPVDGIISEGYASINQSVITGESIPVDKSIGDEVISGTINGFSTFKYKATKVEKDSSLQRIIKLAKDVDINKAKIVKKADKWGMILVIVAFSTACLTTLVFSIMNNDFWFGFERGVTVLVVFCPCAFILATPTAILAGIGNLTKKGVIIKDGKALERLADCKYVGFDKTGTLTYGKPIINKICSIDYSNQEILKLAASLEKYSEHPLGHAIFNSYKGELYQAIKVKIEPGIGINATINNNHYALEKPSNLEKINRQLLNQEDEAINHGSTVVNLIKNNEVIGFISLIDEIRTNSSNLIKELKEAGYVPVLLTGDNEKVAKEVAMSLGIDEVYYQLKPEDKMNLINDFNNTNKKICMIGDGINDALALKSAQAGIALGGIGSDITIENSDAILVNDNIETIPYLLYMAKKTLRKININIVISLFINALAVSLSIAGLLNPITGAIVHNVGSVFVVFNSLLLLFTKNKKK